MFLSARSVFERLQRHASLHLFSVWSTSPDTIEQVLASYLGMKLHAPLKNCVNKKHCYERQLLPVDSGGSLIQNRN